MKPSSLGMRFLASVSKPADLMKVSEDLFDQHECPVYLYMKQHLTKFGVIPDKGTVETHTSVELPQVKEPAAYFEHHLKERRIDAVMRSTIEEVKPFFSKDNSQPMQALELFEAMTTELMRVRSGAAIVDYRKAKDPVIDHYSAVKASGGMLGSPLGWPYLDDMMGGAQPGDLLSLVARPGKGKTFALCYAALYCWLMGKKPLFVTIEMTALKIMQRIAAVNAHIPSTELKLGKLTSKAMTQLEKTLGENADAPNPFYIVDGTKGVSIDELLVLARQLQPDMIFVDGAYMLRHPNKLLTKFRRIDEIADFLKMDLAGGYECPVFATWQFNREATKKKKDTPVGLEDIAHSDVIGQISNLVMGLFEDDNPSNSKEKTLTVLKGREGEEGEFKIGWDFQGMNFAQTFPLPAGAVEPDDEELLDG